MTGSRFVADRGAVVLISQAGRRSKNGVSGDDAEDSASENDAVTRARQTAQLATREAATGTRADAFNAANEAGRDSSLFEKITGVAVVNQIKAALEVKEEAEAARVAAEEAEAESTLPPLFEGQKVIDQKNPYKNLRVREDDVAFKKEIARETWKPASSKDEAMLVDRTEE